MQMFNKWMCWGGGASNHCYTVSRITVKWFDLCSAAGLNMDNEGARMKSDGQIGM